MVEENVFSKGDLVADLKNIGVEKGDLLHLKVSLRAIGKIENGPKGLLDALLEAVGEDGTLVIDSFINAFPLPLSDEDAKKIADDHTPSYAGALANAMIKHPKMIRSKHHIQKFTAIGALAQQLCENHTPQKGGYDLLHEMAKLKAKNLTIGKNVVGVGTTHVAIDLLGFERKNVNAGINYIDTNGNVKFGTIDWNGGCGKGFPKFIPLYKDGLLKRAKIGNAESILTAMDKTLEEEIKILEEDPKFFFCDDPTCYSCRMSWKHSDKKHIKFAYHWLKKNFSTLSFKRVKNLMKIFYGKS